MPITVNGIGTRYYFKRNTVSRPGVCRQCQRPTTLTSYDTRLFFVVVFIPVFPLGVKRIIDDCPLCSKHYVMDLAEWEKTRQIEIAGALDKYRDNPTAEAALDAHGRILAFHQFAEAEKFRQEIQSRFQDNADVQLKLAEALVQFAQSEAALPYFQRALTLRPDLPEARVGVATGYLRQNRLDEAHQLLEFLQKPGAMQIHPLFPLEQLADAYQKADRHQEALDLYRVLIAAMPDLPQKLRFRRKVRLSENAMSVRTSLLPAWKFNWNELIPQWGKSAGNTSIVRWVVGIGLAVVLLFMIIGNEYVRRHRVLQVVADCAGKVKVEVIGVGIVNLTRGREALPIKEGRYHARITGAVNEEIDFELKSPYWGRWHDHVAWVLNAGGSAILVLREAVYAQPPRQPVDTFHFGTTFEAYPEVTHLFCDLPQRLSMESDEVKTLTQLDFLPGDPRGLFGFLAQRRDFDQAFRLAETRLLAHPEDEAMLGGYLELAVDRNQMDTAERFLKAGLEQRPVRLEWHRLYQGLQIEQHKESELVALYDQWLAAEPANSALLYLRGRLETGRAAGQAYFEKAEKADPTNPYPLFALAYDLLSDGNFSAARPLLKRASELRPKSAMFAEAYYQCRLALGEHAALENELRTIISRNPLEVMSNLRLIDVLVTQDKTNEASQVANVYQNMAGREGGGALDAGAMLSWHWMYVTKNFSEMETTASRLQITGASNTLFLALLEQGRMGEAVRALPADDHGRRDPFHRLILSIAWRLAGDTAQSADYWSQAVKLFEAGDRRNQYCATILSKPTPPTDAELQEMTWPPQQRAILLTALCQQFPARARELAALARRQNYDPSYPHHLLKRATAGL